jgi:hypothetical protein
VIGSIDVNGGLNMTGSPEVNGRINVIGGLAPSGIKRDVMARLGAMPPLPGGTAIGMLYVAAPVDEFSAGPATDKPICCPAVSAGPPGGLSFCAQSGVVCIKTSTGRIEHTTERKV